MSDLFNGWPEDGEAVTLSDEEMVQWANANIDRVKELEAENERLRGIIVKWYEYWPEPWGEGRDGFEMQEFGEKHGILVAEEKTTPCGEGCNCAEFFGDGDTVTCYRLAPEYATIAAVGDKP